MYNVGVISFMDFYTKNKTYYSLREHFLRSNIHSVGGMQFAVYAFAIYVLYLPIYSKKKSDPIVSQQ